MAASVTSVDDLLDLCFDTPVTAAPSGVDQVDGSFTRLLELAPPPTEKAVDLFDVDDFTSLGSSSPGTSVVTPTSPWQPLDVVEVTRPSDSSSVGFLKDEDRLLFDPLAPLYTATASPNHTQESTDSEPTLSKWTVTGGVDLDAVHPAARPRKPDNTVKSEKKLMADPKHGKLNRTMERSFEDLLDGLEEDDLDPDLDDILITGSLNSPVQHITEASFNAMAAQSRKTYTQYENKFTQDKVEETPEVEQTQKMEDQRTIDEIFGEVEETRAEAADLVISEDEVEETNDLPDEPEGVELDDKEEGLEDQEPGTNIEIMVTEEPNVCLEEEKEAVLSDMDDSTTEQHIGELKKEASLDFSAVGETPHLDVNMGKQKSSLSKKGSLARRRKPTRSSVRNILSSSEDSHYQDTTETKTPSPTEVNGFGGGEDVFRGDKSMSPDPTSPPAKKSSHIMMPLPGLGQPMLPRKHPQRTSPDTEMAPAEPKRDPRAMGIKLPIPQLKPTRRERTEQKLPSPEFEKPALNKVTTPEESKKVVDVKDMLNFEVCMPKSISSEEEMPSQQVEDMGETDVPITKPQLKSVPGVDPATPPVVESPYRIPLRRVDSGHERSTVSPDEDTGSDKLSDTTALKKVEWDQRGRSKISPEKEGRFDVPALKTVPSELRRSESLELESDKTFNKPLLRNTPKAKIETPVSPMSRGKFDLPSLKRTPKIITSESIEQDIVIGAFDIPNLKNTPGRLLNTQLDFSEASSETKHTFDLPTLKNTPRRSKVDVVGGAPDQGKEEELSWLMDRRLRKTSTKEENLKDDKPEWLKTAAVKREKAAEILNTKENQTRSAGEERPQWTDMSRLRKTPNGLPLQEASESGENTLNGKPDLDSKRVRLSSTGSKDSESSGSSRERTPVSGAAKDHYVPSWLKDTHHKSTPNLSVMSPPTTNSTGVPQWKKDLAERRKLRKENSVDTPIKSIGESDAGAASWKMEFAMKKRSTPAPKTTADIRTSEPEWKKRADEKRQRLINSGLLDKKRTEPS